MKGIANWAFIAALVAFAIAANAEPSSQTAIEYTVADLGLKMEVSGINARGEISGTLITNSESAQAMIWTKGSWHRLGSLGGSYSVARGINDDGKIVGSSTTA